MKMLVYAAFAFALAAPAAVFAATITTTSVSSSDTGGVHANSGQSVTTSSSGSSVHISNTIQADDSGGSATTIIETSQDGKTTREEKTETYAPGENITVTAHASVAATGTPQVRIEQSKGTSASADDAAQMQGSATSTASTSAPVASHTFVQNIFAFLRGLFSFFN